MSDFFFLKLVCTNVHFGALIGRAVLFSLRGRLWTWRWKDSRVDGVAFAYNSLCGVQGFCFLDGGDCFFLDHLQFVESLSGSSL